MLFAFLSSEGVKSYKLAYSFVLVVLGAGQIIRIFILPLKAKTDIITMGGEEQIVMGNGQFTRVCIYLIASAALCIAAGIIAFLKTRTLAAYQAELEKSKGSKS